MREYRDEHPRDHWPESCVNVKGRVVLDLGCGFFGLANSFREGHTSWFYHIPLTNMISTTQHWLNLGAKRVIGLDPNEDDIEHLRGVVKEDHVLFLAEPIKSSLQIKSLVKTFGVDVIKADIEGAESYIIDLSDEDFCLVKEYYIEIHSQELFDNMYRKLTACGYQIREISKSQEGPVVMFFYRDCI